MAIYRTVHVNFWEDSKILDDMNIEERYFWLYLLTNPHTNQVGCFEISKRQIKNETDFENTKINELLNKFENEFELINYSPKTKEIFIKNWYKYHWSNSPKVLTCIENEFVKIKDESLQDKVLKMLEKTYAKDTLSIEYINGIYRVGIKEKEKEKEKKYILSSKLDNTHLFSEIIACFNKVGVMEDSFIKNKIEFHFKNTKNNQKLIQAILDKGYTKEDIMDVIYLKYDQWIEEGNKNSIDMSTYYRPSTILGEKFEEYLQEAKMKGIS